MKHALVLLSLLVSAHAFAGDASAPLTTQNLNDEKETLVGDAVGRTLYVFDLDQGSDTSKCSGDCAEVWPPYLISPAEVATLKVPLGAVTRANHKTQLTYEGRPVYTYAFDRKVGDDQGDGIGGVWHYIEIGE